MRGISEILDLGGPEVDDVGYGLFVDRVVHRLANVDVRKCGLLDALQANELLGERWKDSYFHAGRVAQCRQL